MNIPTAHRPWPAPERPWRIFMRWHELMFMHWDVPASVLRPLIPAGLELDTFDGRAWLGVVPFRMSGIRHRFLPTVPGLSALPELNVRTYVAAQGKPGVWFFSLDAASKVAVRGARWCFHLPYFDAQMRCERHSSVSSDQLQIRYRSHRTHRGAPAADYEGTYGPVGGVELSKPGTLEYFLTERYCLYAADAASRIYRCDIAHAPWPLQRAQASLTTNTMADSIIPGGVGAKPLLHYVDVLDVIVWMIKPI